MKRCVFAVLMLAACIATAGAAPVSLTFTGTILSTDPNGPYAGVSGSFSGGLTYDTVGSDILEPPPDVGNYMFLESPYNFFLNLPGSSIFSPSSGVGVYDDGGAGIFASDTIELSTKFQGIGYIAMLTGPNSSFAGDAIPETSLVTSFWETGTFNIWGPAFAVWLVGSIDSVSAVPEPATLPLLVLGLLGLVAFRRWVSQRGSGNDDAAGSPSTPD